MRPSALKCEVTSKDLEVSYGHLAKLTIYFAWLIDWLICNVHVNNQGFWQFRFHGTEQFFSKSRFTNTKNSRWQCDKNKLAPPLREGCIRRQRYNETENASHKLSNPDSTKSYYSNLIFKPCSRTKDHWYPIENNENASVYNWSLKPIESLRWQVT